jgi:hypothetical protein
MTTALERLATALADRYRIDHEIGSGGMATVYLAHDLRPELDRRVAIKVLHPEYSSAVAVERFLREVALATCYCSTGRRAEIAAIYDELSARARGGYIQKKTLAVAAAAADRLDEAFELPERACDDRDSILIYSKRRLGFRLLQDDPRMAAIHRRIGFTD